MQKIIRFAYVALAALILTAVFAYAQPPDFSKVQIKTTKLADNFYTLEGQGGTIGVLTGPDGVFMVDSQFAPLSEKIAAAIKQISDKPIRFMVNTHVHGDHTGGDENFGRMGVTILARENLRNRLMRPNPPQGNAQPIQPTQPVGLPMITYNGQVVFHMNGEDIRLIPIIAAHTDGDTMVYFPKADVIMTGDFYRSVQYPNIDRANGGSLNGMINGLGQIVGLAGPDTKIVPGHGPVVKRDAVIAHRDVILGIRDKVSKLVEQGKSQDEVVAAKPQAEYDARIQQVAQTGDRFVGQVYAELKGLPR